MAVDQPSLSAPAALPQPLPTRAEVRSPGDTCRAPDLDTDGWGLDSGVERHLEAPTTFEIPGEEIRSRLVPECEAKLMFRMKTQAGDVVVERMWVHVTGYTEDGYTGILNSQPKTEGVSLALGDRVDFHPDHVIDALPPTNWNPETGE